MTLSDYIEYRGAPWPAVVDFVLKEVNAVTFENPRDPKVSEILRHIWAAWGVTPDQFRAFLEDYRKEWLKDIPRQ